MTSIQLKSVHTKNNTYFEKILLENFLIILSVDFSGQPQLSSAEKVMKKNSHSNIMKNTIVIANILLGSFFLSAHFII